MLDKTLLKKISKRKTIYPNQFTGKKIPKKTIEKLLNVANTAPSHKLTQPWFFKVFSGTSKYDLAQSVYKLNKKKKFEVILDKFNLSSHIICICIRKSNKIPYWEEIAATAMAIQNIWISLVGSKNIGGYWSSPKNIKQLANYLKLKKNEECLGLFYLGEYDNVKDRKVMRKNIEDDIEWYD